MRILLFFLPTVVKVLDLENSLRNIQTDILNVESWNRSHRNFLWTGHYRKSTCFCAIAPFVTTRPFEMFRNDLGYMNQNVKVVGRNCGITYSDLGATHHSLEDFAIVRMIRELLF